MCMMATDTDMSHRSNYHCWAVVKFKKKKWGNATPFLFVLPSFTLPFPPHPCCESAPWKPARGSGSSVSFSSGVRGEAPAAYAFWCILSSKSAPGGNIFKKKRPKKKQPYQQEVPERHSKIYTNKNFRGNLEFPGGIPPGYMSGRNTGPSRL